METKTFRAALTLKAGSEETGEFSAIFSTLNVIDHDGDVTVPGAFKDGQAVRISYWGHRWGDLPVGKGVIHSDEEKAWVDGAFFLDTAGGSETYKTVKNLGELQEWSYGFDILKRSWGKFEDQEVQFLEGLEVYEVSPVLLGAGIGTGTTAIKGDGGGARLEPGGPRTGSRGDAGGGGGQAGGDAGEPSGPPPQVVLTQIEIELTEV